MQERKIKNREKIISFLKNSKSANRPLPTLEEIATGIGLKSRTSTFKYIKEMEEEGLISRVGHRGIKLNQKVVVPIVGSIACGLPSFAEQNIEDFVEILKDDLGNGDFFILRASGESMINAGIHDGDLVIIKRQNSANDGQIVVALVEDEATLKRIKFDRKNRKS